MPELRRTRQRRSQSVDREKIYHRVKKFYDEDLTNNTSDREARIQRYAKFRMWTEGKDFPWESASDIGLPDMMEKSLRLQDTLHNAVMSQRPPVSAVAHNKGDKNKQETIDNLIDYQFFSEQCGEEIVGELADAFTNDGVFTAFIPWVRERREVSDTRLFDPIPADALPFEYFSQLLAQAFPQGRAQPASKDGWDWSLSIPGEFGVPERATAKFYTRPDGTVEMAMDRAVVVYDGPRVIVKDYEDVLHPARAANLQPPGPSNPGGSPHVIMRDFPSVDEIKRLAKSGFYDLITKEELGSLDTHSPRDQDNEEEIAKDDLAGRQESPAPLDVAKSHTKLTRLTCFDCFDIDGDGIDEDMIFWVLLEPAIVIKARRLTEMYPANPPRRPFAEASMIPIRGRRNGISMLEMVENIHDTQKVLFDQTVDSGTLANAPFGFYRASGSMKPEVLRLWPGEMYPLADPSRDVNFPQLGGNQQSFGINMLTILGQMEERLTTIGDLQLGRVPAGKSSALRTSGNMAMLQSQGEARPERILRRFFVGLSEIWAQIHELNQHFLPKEKQFRVSGITRPSEDPYQNVTDKSEIAGRFSFTFSANVLNTSKQAIQESLRELLGTYVSGLGFQLGIVGPDQVYRLFRDYGKSLGQDPDIYLKEPSPGAAGPFILAEEAIHQIMNSQMPEGRAAEQGGTQEHLQKLQAFFESDNFGMLDQNQTDIFKVWADKMADVARVEAQQQAQAQAAQELAQSRGGGQAGRPPEQGPPDLANAQVAGGELLDESLPTAGGGANPGGVQ